MLALAQHSQPRQPSLHTFQYKSFEKALFVTYRDPPLFVMVLLIERVTLAPRTSGYRHAH
jgi:hypothetical protein